uniref:Uncharacterized protein n=1 Tax=Vespula pensylvanica TaxID=30213 RepID=A0A834NLA1_VESPE|nr:hypothetical protein H0235_013166 [Vespula pensylvanica]
MSSEDDDEDDDDDDDYDDDDDDESNSKFSETKEKCVSDTCCISMQQASIRSTTIPKLWSESSGPEDNTPGGPMDYSCEETHDGCGIWVPRATTALFISPLCIKKNEQE